MTGVADAVVPCIASWSRMPREESRSKAYLELENVLHTLEFLLESVIGGPVSTTGPNLCSIDCR